MSRCWLFIAVSVLFLDSVCMLNLVKIYIIYLCLYVGYLLRCQWYYWTMFILLTWLRYILYIFCLYVGYLLRLLGIVLLSWFPLRFPLTLMYYRVIDIHGRYLYMSLFSRLFSLNLVYWTGKLFIYVVALPQHHICLLIRCEMLTDLWIWHFSYNYRCSDKANRGRDRKVVGFPTTCICVITAYHH